jgi:hypothetical protein
MKNSKQERAFTEASKKRIKKREIWEEDDYFWRMMARRRRAIEWFCL